MQRVSIARRLGQRWMILLAVVVLAVAEFAVYRLHGVFASDNVTATTLPAVTANAYTYCLDKCG